MNLSKYGITIGEYNKMLSEQNNLCYTCRSKCKLCIDHNHISGKVRGLLCNKCNLILGLCSENISTLNKCVEYLEKHYDPDWDVQLLKNKLGLECQSKTC